MKKLVHQRKISIITSDLGEHTILFGRMDGPLIKGLREILKS
jgi:hypothetical protein